jgi:P27 family predicted phage terminase small subunit
MPAGRPRKPSAVKEAMGNPGKRASNKREPDPEYLADLTPPDWLPEGAKVIWREEAPKFRKARLLTEIDVMAFADLCVAQWDFRRAVLKTGENDVKAKLREDEDGNVQEVGEHVSPWAIVKSMSSKRMNGLLSKFGATPADRSRVEINPQASLFGDDKPHDPASAFFH